MNDDELKQPSEEELRAAFEEQLRNVSVEDVILQTVATLVNLGARRLGLLPEPGEDPAAIRDMHQAKLAIDGARALAPLCPADHQDSIKQALSQLQMAYARAAQESGEAAPAGTGAPAEDPAQAPGEPAAAPKSPDPSEAERAKVRAKIWTPPGS